ncbi:MAG: hypothetical protein ACOCV1_05145 [Bacillota bacterium]
MSFDAKKQLSFDDLYEKAKDWVQNDKLQSLEILNQYLDLSEFIPSTFYNAQIFWQKRRICSRINAFCIYSSKNTRSPNSCILS